MNSSKFLNETKGRLQCCIDTDKQHYHSHDIIYIRLIFLNTFTQCITRYEHIDGFLKVYNGCNNIYYSGVLPDIVNGVIMLKVELKGVGGVYRIVMESKEVPEARRSVYVMNRRRKCYKIDLKFMKRGYGNGDTVKALLNVLSKDGGVLKRVDVKVNVEIGKFKVVKEYCLVNCSTQLIQFDVPKELDLDSIEKGTILCIVKHKITESIVKKIPLISKKNNLEFKFYGESGRLVQNVNNGVYFSVMLNNEPSDVEGLIIDSDKNIVVTKIKTVHEGRGYFTIKPIPDKKYFLQLVKPSGIKNIDLSEKLEISEDGISMMVMNEKGGILIKLVSSEKIEVKIGVFRKEKKLLQTEVFELVEFQETEMILDKPKISGVVRITLFVVGEDDEEFPVAERLVFIKPERELSIDITSSKTCYLPGEKVELLIKTRTNDNKNINSKLLVKVVDDNVSKIVERRKRLPRFIQMVYLEDEVDELTDPLSYFENDEYLDLLLGIQGWRKFIYNYSKCDFINKGLTVEEKKLFRLLNITSFYDPFKKLMKKRKKRPKRNDKKKKKKSGRKSILSKKFLDFYSLVSQLGEGDIGISYKAIKKDDGKSYCVKSIKLNNSRIKYVKWLRAEIRLLQEVSRTSDHLISIYDFFYSKKSKDSCYILSELSSFSMCDIINVRQKVCTEEEIKSLVVQVLKGLVYLHQLKKFHGNLKCSNLLLNERGELKLADYYYKYIAIKMLENEKQNTFIGSSYWMSPEQITEEILSPRSDIWSLAITIIELAEGRPPLSGCNPLRVIFMIPNRPPPQLRDPDKWSKEMKDFIVQCLKKDYKTRPSAKELLQHPFLKDAKSVFQTITPLVDEVYTIFNEYGGREGYMNVKKEAETKEYYESSDIQSDGSDNSDGSDSGTVTIQAKHDDNDNEEVSKEASDSSDENNEEVSKEASDSSDENNEEVSKEASDSSDDFKKEAEELIAKEEEKTKRIEELISEISQPNTEKNSPFVSDDDSSEGSPQVLKGNGNFNSPSDDSSEYESSNDEERSLANWIKIFENHNYNELVEIYEKIDKELDKSLVLTKHFYLNKRTALERLITTKNKISYVRVYAHKKIDIKNNQRKDFTETLYFSSCDIMELSPSTKEYEKRIEFDLNDSISSFSVSVDALTDDGILGSSVDYLIKTQKPFYIEYKIPKEINISDKLQFPITVCNNSENDSDYNLSITSKKDGLLFKEHEWKGKLKSNDMKLIYCEMEANDVGIYDIIIKGCLVETLLEDSVSHRISVKCCGFPFVFQKSDILKNNTKNEYKLSSFPQNYVKNSLSSECSLISSQLALLTSSLKSLIKQPTGCFEQCSAKLFPLIMAKLFFNEYSDNIDHELLSSTDSYLEQGYAKIKSYEVSGGGFSLYGKGNACEKLSAIGIQQLSILKKIFPVDNDVLIRAKDLLLSRMTKTGFKYNSKYFSYGKCSQITNDVYLLWSLSKCIVKNKEVEDLVIHFCNEIESNRDCYVIGLLSLTLFNIGKVEKSKELASMLTDYQEKDGSFKQSITSITRSGGINLILETTAIATLSFCNFKEFGNHSSKSISFILKYNNCGRFGSTQSTVLCLAALYKCYNFKTKKDDVSAHFHINGKLVSSITIPSFSKDPLYFSGISKKIEELHTEDQVISIVSDSDCLIIPYSLKIEYKLSTPPQSHKVNELFNFSCNLLDKTIREGECTEIEVLLENKCKKELSMPVVVICFPSCLDPVIDEVEKIKYFEYFELFGMNKIVFYFDGLRINEKRRFKFPLLASIAGEFSSDSSYSFLYYDDIEKCFSNCFKIKVLPQ